MKSNKRNRRLGRFEFNARLFWTRRLLPLTAILLTVWAGTEACVAAIPATERAALIDIYTATNGAQWTTQTNWKYGGDFSAAGTECQWYGVYCDETNTTVRQIALRSNHLSGTLSNLTAFTNLQFLDLSQNNINGPLPDIAAMTQLVNLDLSFNHFTGSIPPIKGMHNLDYLALGDNLLSGSLPAIEELPALAEFHAGSNQLTGPIPALGGAPGLFLFDVELNQLTGSLPSLDSNVQMQEFYAGNNQLSGHLPSLSGPAWRVFLVSQNRLTGEIPPLNNVPNLTYLDVAANQLVGPVPDLSTTPQLGVLDVSYNSLSGSLPTVLPQSLYSFAVEDNRLSGALPAPPPMLLSANSFAALCPNHFDTVPNAAWDDATSSDPWYVKCTAPTYVALNPERILDTRSGASTIDGQYAGTGSLLAGETRNVPIYGRGSIPTSNIAAVVANVTVTNPQSAGYLTVWQAPWPTPNTSNINFVAGQTVPNSVLVSAAPGCPISIRNASLGSDVIVDVLGYYTYDSMIRFTSGGSMRFLDTRPGYATVDGQFSGAGSVGEGKQIDLLVTARGTVLPSVGAVVVNVTATNPTATGFITVWPTDQARPATSNLNFVKGQTTANLVISSVSSDGRISLFNSAGNTDLIVDINAWFPIVSELTALQPARILDTRKGMKTVDGSAAGAGPIGSGGTLSLPVLGRGGVPSSGVEAVILNVTVTNPSASGNLRVWPTGSPLPNASTLNFVPGLTVPNNVIAKVGMGGSISIFNSAGNTDVVVDVSGWIATP